MYALFTALVMNRTMVRGDAAFWGVGADGLGGVVGFGRCVLRMFDVVVFGVGAMVTAGTVGRGACPLLAAVVAFPWIPPLDDCPSGRLEDTDGFRTEVVDVDLVVPAAAAESSLVGRAVPFLITSEGRSSIGDGTKVTTFSKKNATQTPVAENNCVRHLMIGWGDMGEGRRLI
jgi:hypothetical protein